jgi:hypothetical protein
MNCKTSYRGLFEFSIAALVWSDQVNYEKLVFMFNLLTILMLFIVYKCRPRWSSFFEL